MSQQSDFRIGAAPGAISAPVSLPRTIEYTVVFILFIHQRFLALLGNAEFHCQNGQEPQKKRKQPRKNGE
jgi:hypothetical protein